MQWVLLITGSSGIAEATAVVAAGRGHAVFIVGRDEAQCRELSARLPTSAFFVGDVCDEGTVAQSFASCLERFGHVDAVFNAAGVSGRQFGDGPLHECTLEGWDRTIEANGRPAFLMSRTAVRFWLAEKRPGVILNMSSVLAVDPESQYFGTHAYAASKGAIISLSRAMASYYASYAIRVNVVAPALVRTPMSARAQADPAIQRFIEHKQPLARGMIEAGDVAQTALFLLSPSSQPITGQVVVVDAGWTVSA